MAVPKPLAPIRRFDVFAEFNRLRGLKEEGLAATKAKGYGLWLAKVVAAQKFGRMPRPRAKKKGEAVKRDFDKQKWRKLGGVEQTDKLFDRQIVNRMGKLFYNRFSRQQFARRTIEIASTSKSETRFALRGSQNRGKA